MPAPTISSLVPTLIKNAVELPHFVPQPKTFLQTVDSYVAGSVYNGARCIKKYTDIDLTNYGKPISVFGQLAIAATAAFHCYTRTTGPLFGTYLGFFGGMVFSSALREMATPHLITIPVPQKSDRPISLGFAALGLGALAAITNFAYNAETSPLINLFWATWTNWCCVIAKDYLDFAKAIQFAEKAQQTLKPEEASEVFKELGFDDSISNTALDQTDAGAILQSPIATNLLFHFLRHPIEYRRF